MTAAELVEPLPAATRRTDGARRRWTARRRPWRPQRPQRPQRALWRLLATGAAPCLLAVACSASREPGNGVGAPTSAGSAAEGRQDAPDAAVALRGQHYLLAGGRLTPTTELELADVAAATELRPWTVQARLVASRYLNGATYLAVNGWGFVRVGDLQAAAAEPFDYFYQRELFIHRTLTHLFDWDGELAGHVYVNHLLAEQAVPPAVAERGNLVRLSDGELRAATSPHKALAPDWQSVAVAQLAANEAMLEWKLEDRRGIRFQYTHLTLGQGGAKEVAVSRDLFLAGYRFRGVSDPDVPGPLRELAVNIMVEGQEQSGARSGAYHFVLRDPTAAPIRLRYQPDGATELHTVPLVAAGGGYLALVGGGGAVLATAPHPTLLHLPPLPAGLRYVDLHVATQPEGGEWLIAVWEQARFYRVGAAGITVLPIDGGLPSPALGRG